MSKLLIKYNADWADEFSCEGFAIFDKEDWKNHCKEVKKAFKKIGGEVEIGFGTNEAFTVLSYEDWESYFEIIDLGDADISIFEKYFFNSYDNRIQFGTGSNLIDPLEILNDKIEDIDDEDNEGNGDDFDYGVKD